MDDPDLDELGPTPAPVPPMAANEQATLAATPAPASASNSNTKESSVLPVPLDSRFTHDKSRTFSYISKKLEKAKLIGSVVNYDNNRPRSRHPLSNSPDGDSGYDLADPPQVASTASFPPIYNILRVAKQKKMTAAHLSAPCGFTRLGPKRSGSCAGGLTAEGDDRAFLAQFSLWQKGPEHLLQHCQAGQSDY